MFTEKRFATVHKLNVTILVMLGWLTWMLRWMALAWSGHSFLQNLASLGISTLIFTAITTVVWVGNLNCAPHATILVTLGWVSFMLYWIGFVWGRYSLLHNVAVLIARKCRRARIVGIPSMFKSRTAAAEIGLFLKQDGVVPPGSKVGGNAASPYAGSDNGILFHRFMLS